MQQKNGQFILFPYTERQGKVSDTQGNVFNKDTDSPD